MTEKVRIAIIEDTGRGCAAIAAMLHAYPDIEICGMAENIEDGIKLIISQLPDAVFLNSQSSYLEIPFKETT